jgi:hypothetical protein
MHRVSETPPAGDPLEQTAEAALEATISSARPARDRPVERGLLDKNREHGGEQKASQFTTDLVPFGMCHCLPDRREAELAMGRILKEWEDRPGGQGAAILEREKVAD